MSCRDEPGLVGVGDTHRLVPLYAQAGGQEDAGCKGHMAEALANMVEVCRVEVIELHGYRAHDQVGEEEDEV